MNPPKCSVGVGGKWPEGYFSSLQPPQFANLRELWRLVELGAVKTMAHELHERLAADSCVGVGRRFSAAIVVPIGSTLEPLSLEISP